MTKKTKKQLLNIAFLLVLIGATFTVIFTSQDVNLQDIGNFMYNCNPWYIAGALICLVGYVVFEAISLHVIAHKLGHKSKFTSSLAYSSSDLYYSSITPSASGGQPASAFYMMRDGMSGGTAGFTVLFNIIAYTVATILVGLFGLVACPGMFGDIGHWFAKTLVIIGFVIQFALLGVLLLCLFRARAIRAIGSWGINLLAKLHILKKPEKWLNKLDGVVIKYRSCRTAIKKHPMLFVISLLLNIAQRVSQTLIPCFVIMASPLFASVDVTFLELFCMQAYVLIGYSSIPLPGGMGVYEYLYPNIFGIGFPDMTFVLSAMMVSRGISFYICMIVTGIYTLIYHAIGLKKIKGDGDGDSPPDIPEGVDMFNALKNDSVINAIVDEDRALSSQTKVKRKRKNKNKDIDQNEDNSIDANEDIDEDNDIDINEDIDEDETANSVAPVTYSEEQSEKIQQDEQSKDEASDDGNN